MNVDIGWCMYTYDISISIFFFLSLYYLYICIYLYTLSPSETYWFRFCYCVLQWFLLVLPSKAASIFFHSFEDFGCLNVMNYDVSCVHTMTYFDGICIVFDYRIVLPTKGFNSNMDRMRTDLWPNVNFKLLHEFFTMFLFLLVTHEISDFVRFQILQTYYLMINMVDMSLAFFPYYVASVSCFTTAVAQYFGWCVGLRRS